jgi:small subunit ribosomal protein S2
MCEKSTKDLIIKDFLKASVQYGHKSKEWNPKIAPYISYKKHDFHFFNIVKTSKLLKLAAHVLQKLAEKGGLFLFVGTDKISAPLIAKYAINSGAFYINHRWLGGTLTNWLTIQERIARLKYLEDKDKSDAAATLSKKEFGVQKKEIEKLNKLFCGIKNMKALPDAVVFMNPMKDSLAIEECLKLGIPVVAITDSNYNPNLVPYPIPSNDDSSASLNFILKYLTHKILKGYNSRLISHKK